MKLKHHGKGYIAAVLITTVILVVSLNSNSILQATGELISPPPPVTPVPPGSLPPSPLPFTPPGQTVSPYFVMIPSHRDKILHWVQNSYTYNTMSPDRASGQVVTGEIWERVSADGIPDKFHGYYAFADGSFYQEVLQTSDKTIVVTSDRDPKQVRCQESPSTLDKMRFLLPPFVDRSMLPQHGFKSSGGLTKQLPSTASLPAVKPVETNSSDGGIQGWSSQQVDDLGLNRLKRLEVNSSGRLLMGQTQSTNKSGEIQSETWTTYGTLEIYELKDIPVAQFNLSLKSKEACRG